MIDLTNLPTNCIEPLKEISYDTTNDVYMINNMELAYNFDSIKDTYRGSVFDNSCCYKSADALFQANGKNFLIEFKNGKFTKLDIRLKICDSIMILSQLTESSIEEIRNNIEFILVYNESRRRNRERIQRTVISNSSINEVRFGLNSFQGTYFNTIKTLTASEFSSYILD